MTRALATFTRTKQGLVNGCGNLRTLITGTASRWGSASPIFTGAGTCYVFDGGELCATTTTNNDTCALTTGATVCAKMGDASPTHGVFGGRHLRLYIPADVNYNDAEVSRVEVKLKNGTATHTDYIYNAEAGEFYKGQELPYIAGAGREKWDVYHNVVNANGNQSNAGCATKTGEATFFRAYEVPTSVSWDIVATGGNKYVMLYVDDDNVTAVKYVTNYDSQTSAYYPYTITTEKPYTSSGVLIPSANSGSFICQFIFYYGTVRAQNTLTAQVPLPVPSSYISNAMPALYGLTLEQKDANTITVRWYCDKPETAMTGEWTAALRGDDEMTANITPTVTSFGYDYAAFMADVDVTNFSGYGVDVIINCELTDGTTSSGTTSITIDRTSANSVAWVKFHGRGDS